MGTSSTRRRRLGTIVDVSADRFRVEMAEHADGYTLVGFDGQHYVARIGSLVLIPLTNTYVVAEVSGMHETPDSRSGSSASRSLDDAAHNAIRQLSLAPLGTLPFDASGNFSFGISEFPPLYADVLHIENKDLDRILDVSNQEVEISENGSSGTRLTSLSVGESAVFNDYQVKLRINEFFGSHSAILGNTGSGKSCTIASVMQEALGKQTLAPAGGATFVVFDTNGEYRRALSELPAPIERTYAWVDGRDGASTPSGATDGREVVQQFHLPHWLLSPEEWDLLLQASDRVQRPVLRNALGLTSLFATTSQAQSAALSDHILSSSILQILIDSENDTAARGRILGLINVYKFRALMPGSDGAGLDINEYVRDSLKLHYGSFTASSRENLEQVLKDLQVPDAEIPEYSNRPFEFSDLIFALELAILFEESHGNRRVRDNCSTLLTRVKSLMNREDFEFLRGSRSDMEGALSGAGGFVDNLLGVEREGGEVGKRAQVYILDLGALGDEAVEVVASVVTRLLLDRLRCAVPRNAYPVNLVLEEAHRYLPRQPSNASSIEAPRIFERVAKEGRKYGLFLMLSSQRPSELSGTVLSQCSNYVIHRIQNPDDMQHIRRMTPFVSEAVLNRLASLPKQFALVFGTSVTIPTTFKVRDAWPLPQSDDSDVSKYWYRQPRQIHDVHV